MTTHKPILIIGGGVGGLVLAHALKNKSIPVRIFEKDPFLDFRPQGYRFHLRPDGCEALFACLSTETAEKLKLSSPHYRGPENGRACNVRTGEPDPELLKLAPKSIPGKPSMNIDRSVLRRVLSEDLNIEFGKDFKSYEIHNNCISVQFADGSDVEGLLLVGADGVKSHVRAQLLPDYTLLDTEGRWIWGKSQLTPALRSKLSQTTLQGGLGGQDKDYSELPTTILAESIVFDRMPQNIYSDVLPTDYIYWVLQFAKRTVRVDDETFFSLDSDGAASCAKDLTEEWMEEIRAIIDNYTPGSVAAQPVTAGDPTVPRYNGQGRVTLLGDAIHSMPPTAGAGASSAIQDARWLAEAIEEGGVTRDTLQQYEKTMRTNGSDLISSSESKCNKMFGAPNFADMKRLSPHH